MYPQKLSIANFVCTFGDTLAMLDLYDEVVEPAFFDEIKRSFGESTFFLLGVNYVRVENELYVSGRIVKDTVVKRDQYYEDGEIIADPQQIESSPSSFFSLKLSNHKLYFVRENANAPSIKVFESTMQYFLNRVYDKWIKDLYSETNSERRVITWAKLMEKWPRPNLEVTPLATENSVSAFVEKFRTVNAVEIKLLRTNHELDNSPIFGDMREVGGKIGAETVSIKTQRAGEVGLEKGEVAKLVSGQALDGNAKISITGKSLGGDRMQARNESFSLSVPIKEVSKKVVEATQNLVDAVAGQVAVGLIRLAKGPAKAYAKVAELMGRIDWV